MHEAFPEPGLPSDSTIHVWQVELDRPWDARPDAESLLSPDERERANRFVRVRDAVRFRHCRAMLRLGLSWYLGCSPREIAFQANSAGKPHLGFDSALRFNVSHSGGLALLAFSTLGEVGIDLELDERKVEAMEIASSHFTAKEIARIAALPTPQAQSSDFLRLWTRKEAVLKAAGQGIGHGLGAVDVSGEPAGMVTLRNAYGPTAESQWRLDDLATLGPVTPGGFVGALAAPPGDWRVLQWAIRCEEVLKRIPA